MKVLLVIFVIYISHVICDGNTYKYAVKSFPKKVKPYGNGKIVINSGKYEFKAKSKPTIQPNKRLYTVFQVVGISKTIQGVPESPYFPGEQTFDHKTRVKKVLPEYPWSSLRSKRSAILDAPPAEPNDKPTETTTEKPKLEKTVEENKSSASTKETKKESMSTKEIDPENVKKKETTTDKGITTVSDKDKPKREKSDSKATTEGLPKREDKYEFRSNDKQEPKSDTKSDAETNKGKESLKNLTNTEKSTSRPPSKTKDTNSDQTTRKFKPLVDENNSATNVKAKPKVKTFSNKDNSTVGLRSKKSKGKNIIARANEGNVTTKAANIKHKKNNTTFRGKKGGKKQKRKGQAKKHAQAKKGHKAAPKRTKKTRSRKLKSKPANGTRAGKKPKAQRRLIAAREALIEDYPYVVSIQKNEEHWCSGALLNPRLVITTANCLWKANRISRMEVRAGSRHVDHGGQMAGIQEVMKHPNWGLRKSPDNDIALVLLNRNIKFSDSCHAVDLPNRVMMPPFDDAWVTSWGSERRDGVYDKDSTSLQVYHARLIEREKCNNVTMRFSVLVTENFICLAQMGKTAPCTRDTGAPAVSDGVLWGLASWGIRKLCGTERFPAMFSYIASHSNLDFITNATHFLMSDKRFYPYGDRFPVRKAKSSSSSAES